MSAYEYYTAPRHEAQDHTVRIPLDHNEDTMTMHREARAESAEHAPTPQTTAELFRRELERVDVDTDFIPDDALLRLYRAALCQLAYTRTCDFTDAFCMMLDSYGGAA